MKSILSHRCLVLGASLLTLLSGINSVSAAPAKKVTPAKKPATPQPKLIREVLGTTAMTGYEGVIGLTYTLGKEMPFNFTIRKVEYTVGRVVLGGNTHFPEGDEKLLVVHYTVQNPRKTPFNYSSSYLTLKAVDSTGVTRDGYDDAGREITHESLNYALQPGQKIDAYAIVHVAAFGPVPKLIAQAKYEPKAPIIRYNLNGKVPKLPAPYSDKDGVTALKMVPGKVGVFYPLTEYFDVRVDSLGYSYEKMYGRTPDTGQRYLVATVTVKNQRPSAVTLSSSFFHVDLKDEDGEKTNWNDEMLKATRDERVSAQLQPGEEARGRFYWMIPEGVKGKTLLMQYGYDHESRTYAIDITGLAKEPAN